ncbi:MAG: OmpA family protein [Alphaproteobacteria bacterium]|nr:OmpA family protein [Alphaproteobacteria bacterium]
MARKKEPEFPHEDHPDETWLVPYSDLLCLLLALFIVLFSSSNMDKNKAAQMEYSLAAAFNAIPADQQNGTVLNFMEDAASLDMGEDVGIGADGKGAVLDINSLILFDGNSIKIKEEAKPTLDKIAQLLSENKYKRFQIVVEGHTDDVPFRSAEFPSNWELSSARAGAIVRYFITKELVPSRFQAVGMAGISPKYPNLNHFGEPIPENRIRNRRVVIHVEI